MKIQLLQDLESPLRAEVLDGHFADEDEAVNSIVREYFLRKGQATSPVAGQNGDEPVPAATLDQKPIWEVVDELREAVPPEEFAKLPVEGEMSLRRRPILGGSDQRLGSKSLDSGDGDVEVMTRS